MATEKFWVNFKPQVISHVVTKILLLEAWLLIKPFLTNLNPLRVLNKTKNRIIADKASLAGSFFSRARGLLGQKSINSTQALIITRCNSIHMFFMQFPIDAIFVNQEGIVVGLVENIKPNRMSKIFWKASYVVELKAGAIRETGTQINDEIVLD